MTSSKILFVDLESPRGHQDVDFFFMKNVFPHFSPKHFLLERSLYEEIAREYDLPLDDPPFFFPPPPGNRKKTKISLWRNKLDKLRFLLQLLEREAIDTLFFLSYDTLSLSLLSAQFLKYRVILMNHDNVHRFGKNALRRFLFRRLRAFHHVFYSSALNDAVRRYLGEEMGCNRVSFIDHQVNERSHPLPRRFSRDSISLLIPSESTDPAKVLRLLDSVKNPRIRVRAKVTGEWYRKSPPAFRESLFTGFMGKTEYDGLMQDSDLLLLLYPGDYRYRTSGLMFDALSHERPVITDNEFIYNGWVGERGIGMLVKEPEEVEGVVLRLEEERYNRYVENMRRFKESLPAEALGRTIAGQIKEILQAEI